MKIEEREYNRKTLRLARITFSMAIFLGLPLAIWSWSYVFITSPNPTILLICDGCSIIVSIVLVGLLIRICPYCLVFNRKNRKIR